MIGAERNECKILHHLSEEKWMKLISFVVLFYVYAFIKNDIL
jgi:hypothetical protein